jgi:CRP-like cAMP-binding protein
VVIKSGIVQLIKPIPKPGLMQVKRSNDKTHGLVINEEFDEVPGLWILQKSWNTHLDDELKRQYGPNVEHVDFTVAILGSGQLFGELAALDPNQPSPVAAVTSTAVELYCLESDVLLAAGARYNATTLGALRESLTLNDPPAEKIGYYFRSKYSWELRKDKIITRLTAGKL